MPPISLGVDSFFASGFSMGHRALQATARRIERNGFKLNRHRALDLWRSMIFSENRYPLFRIMLQVQLPTSYKPQESSGVSCRDRQPGGTPFRQAVFQAARVETAKPPL